METKKNTLILFKTADQLNSKTIAYLNISEKIARERFFKEYVTRKIVQPIVITFDEELLISGQDIVISALNR